MIRRHVGSRDLLGEALAAIAARTGRAMLTCAATTIGVASLVATLGLTATARAQISSRFDAVAATEVRVEDVEPTNPAEMPTFPSDVEDRISRVAGVRDAGLFWEIDTGGANPRTNWRSASTADSDTALFAASPRALGVLDLTITRGRLFDTFHDARNAHVMLLSDTVAKRLGITDVDRQPAVFVGDETFTVIGIYSDVRRHSEVLLGGIIPRGSAQAGWGFAASGPHQLIIETNAGAAQVVARQAPIAIRPDAPQLVRAVAPPDPHELRNAVDSEVANLFVGLGLLAVTIGAFGIANITLVGVLERLHEIGLRRAVGARRRDVAAQFLAESSLLGTLGGMVGAAIGLIAIASVSFANTWTATVDPVAVLLAPLLGTVTGVLAGVYPSARAAKIVPAEALRS